MTRICFVGVDNYFMLNPAANTKPVNGEAVQQVLLARAFRSLNFDVSTVVHSLEKDIDETIDGIRVLSAFKRGAGIPIVRFFHPRATGVFRTLNEVDADVYYESPAGALTGLTAAFCRWKNKKFIFRVASDVDCIPGRQLIKHWRDRKLFEYGLRRADVVAVQSQHQADLLVRHYDLASHIVNMVLDAPTESLHGPRDIDVLWISNIKHVKRPDRLLAIARRLPDVRFTMIGGVVQDEQSLYTETAQEAARLSNVDFLGQVPYDVVNEHVARSRVLLNTSDIEGFPNTFLQAWARKVPVVSYFDPDGIIQAERLGFRPDDEADMCDALQKLLSDKTERIDIGEKAHAFVLTRYSAESAAKRYLELCG